MIVHGGFIGSTLVSNAYGLQNYFTGVKHKIHGMEEKLFLTIALRS